MLLLVVLVLLIGITALLGVAYQRHQRLEDATIDLRRNLTQQENKILELQDRLEDCDTMQTNTLPLPDTSWNSPPVVKPGKAAQAPPPEW